jgi:hypothetical protein
MRVGYQGENVDYRGQHFHDQADRSGNEERHPLRVARGEGFGSYLAKKHDEHSHDRAGHQQACLTEKQQGQGGTEGRSEDDESVLG